MRPFGQSGMGGGVGGGMGPGGGFGGGGAAMGGGGGFNNTMAGVMNGGGGGAAMSAAPAFAVLTPQFFEGTNNPPNANHAGFPGYPQNFTTVGGTAEEYLVKSIVCEGKNFGVADQNFSSDMLRWDDYRQVKSINDGTPSLKTTFDTTKEGTMQYGIPFQGHREVTQKTNNMGQMERINILYKVFVTHPRLSGNATQQTFCSEMDRWDTMRVEKSINDGTPNMRDTFGGAVTVPAPVLVGPGGQTAVNQQVRLSVHMINDTDTSKKTNTPVGSNAPPPLLGGGGATVVNATGLNQNGVFTGYQTETVTNAGVRSYNTYHVRVCKPIYEGAAQHNWSSEMLRWDDYRQAKGINDGIGVLQQIFDQPR